ncbi:MAG: BMP family ABC transporter substrate-binding protein [Actinobacteria bacterium]|nr:BMP family ABC transporter substrate-binding protein [Actinomycetota bacterium]
MPDLVLLVVVGLVAYYFAVAAQASLVVLLLTSYGIIAQLAPPVVAALYWRRATTAGALTGLVAGSLTETGLIGYVAAFPIPEVLRGINAFTLGVREVNPEAQVQVVWTSTWFDPAIERQAADSVLDAGADVVSMHQDSPATGEAAEEAAASVQRRGVDAVVVDAEDGAHRMGLARRLAESMGARYLPLADLSAGALEGALRPLLE